MPSSALETSNLRRQPFIVPIAPGIIRPAWAAWRPAKCDKRGTRLVAGGLVNACRCAKALSEPFARHGGDINLVAARVIRVGRAVEEAAYSGKEINKAPELDADAILQERIGGVDGVFKDGKHIGTADGGALCDDAVGDLVESG